MIIPPGFAHVLHSFRLDGTDRRAAITYGIELAGSAFLDARAADIHAAAAEHLMPELTTNTVLERTLVKQGPNDVGPVAEFAQSVSGGANEGVSPPNTAYLVRKRTALGGRRNRGRLFLPGVAESNVGNGGQVAAGTVAALQTAFDDFRDALTALDSPLVLLHSASSDPTDIIRLVVDARVATQRRRLRG